MSPPRIKYLVALKVFEPEPPLQNKINGFFFANKLKVLLYIIATFSFFLGVSDMGVWEFCHTYYLRELTTWCEGWIAVGYNTIRYDYVRSDPSRSLLIW